MHVLVCPYACTCVQDCEPVQQVCQRRMTGDSRVPTVPGANHVFARLVV